MPFLSTIFGFLLIFSIYTATQFYRLNNFALVNEAYAAQNAACEAEIQEACKKRAALNYYEIAKTYSDEEPPELTDTEASQQKPGRNSRLSRKAHLSLLISQDPAQLNDQNYKSSLIIFKNLLSILYAEAPFFKEAKEENPRLEDDLIHAIVEKGYKDKIQSAEQLANLELDDELLQSVLFKMLVGSKKKNDKATEQQVDGYYSLLSFLSFQKKAQAVSAYLAPQEILLAVFQNDQVVADIMEERMRVYKEITASKTANQQLLTEQFQNKFKDQIPSDIDKNLIDFRISKTKP